MNDSKYGKGNGKRDPSVGDQWGSYKGPQLGYGEILVDGLPGSPNPSDEELRRRFIEMRLARQQRMPAQPNMSERGYDPMSSRGSAKDESSLALASGVPYTDSAQFAPLGAMNTSKLEEELRRLILMRLLGGGHE